MRFIIYSSLSNIYEHVMRIVTLIISMFLSLEVCAADNDARAYKLYEQVRCPTCVAQSVNESDTIASEHIRNFIVSKIAEGKTDDEILSMLREYYGDDLVLKPRVSSHTFLLWAIPLSVFLFGLRSIIKRRMQRIH